MQASESGWSHRPEPPAPSLRLALLRPFFVETDSLSWRMAELGVMESTASAIQRLLRSAVGHRNLADGSACFSTRSPAEDKPEL